MARKKKTNMKVNTQLLIMILFSIVLGILTYARQGEIGIIISNFLGGVFGIIKYFLPIALCLYTIFLMSEKQTKVSSKLLIFFIFFLLINIVLAVFQISKGTINIEREIKEVLQASYDLGVRDIGGGLLGTVISIPLVKMIGTIGTSILSIGICIILAVRAFNFNVIDDISEFSQNVKQKKLEKKKNAEIRRKQEEKLKREEEKLRAREQKVTLEEEYSSKKNKPSFIEKYGAKIGEEQININILDDKKYDFEPEIQTIKEQKKDSKKELSQNNSEKLDIKTENLIKEDNYEFPPITLMGIVENKEDGNTRKKLLETAEKLRKTLYSFGVSAKVENVSVGPAITRYEISPAEGVRVNKISNLSDDIALSLEAETIRIEAPIPGKHTVGIEVPNKVKSMVGLREILESDEFTESKSKLAFALGKDIGGEAVVTDIAKMPHLLIAGSTGSGKSVCINTLITSIIYKSKPSEVKLLMVDPKVVELSVYNGIPHLLIPVITDPRKAADALKWSVEEMVKRYGYFAEKKVRDIKGYNEQAIKNNEQTLPQIVIIIDELADLMMVAGKEVEDSICRLAQMARAAGMHLVIATQRPSVDVITGIIKANIPSRISFAVSSQVDSRTILDSVGAEKLLGKGDMLFFPSGTAKPTRLQGAFVSDAEVEKIVEYIRTDEISEVTESILDRIENLNKTVSESEDEDDDDRDDFLEQAIEEVINAGTASTSFIQRKLKVGYARAGRIIDQMEQRGIISGFQGSKPREVLITKERWAELNSVPDNNPKVEE